MSLSLPQAEEKGRGQVGPVLFLPSAFFVCFFFWPCHPVCGILKPLPGIEPLPLAVKAWSPNNGTAREFPWSLPFRQYLHYSLNVQREWKSHPFQVVFVEVRSDVNEHFLSRKPDFSDISYAFTEAPNSWCWEGRGGRRLEGGEGCEEAGAAGFGVLGDRSTRGQIPASICTGDWHLGRPWPQEGPWVTRKKQPEPQKGDSVMGATACSCEGGVTSPPEREREVS